jgi:tRNA(adenine34) deaminase
MATDHEVGGSTPSGRTIDSIGSLRKKGAFIISANKHSDEAFMQVALREARKALRKREVPVGAVVVLDGRILARGHNERESKSDPTAHAEIIALRKAGRKLKDWRLSRATVYVTCEPCAMCAGAMVLARVERLVYGCKDEKAGAVESMFGICKDSRLNHRLEVTSGVMEDECRAILQEFFQKLRQAMSSQVDK